TDPDPAPVFTALSAALKVVDQDHARLYTDFLLAVLPVAAKARLEELMDLATYEFQSDYWRRWEAEGKALARAKVEAELMAEAVTQLKDEVKADIEARAKAEVEAQIKAEVEAQIKADIEAQIKAEVEAQIKADIEARAKAEVEAQIKADIEAQAKAEI